MMGHSCRDRAAIAGTIESDDFHKVGNRAFRSARSAGRASICSRSPKDLALVVHCHDLNLLRFRSKNANDQIVAGTMRAEDTEWISMGSVEKGGDLARVDRVNGK
jgi:hypothetical protein